MSLTTGKKRNSVKPKKKKRVSVKPKKSKQELEDERKRREQDRAKRDAERAKKRFSLRAKIVAKKEDKDKKKETTLKGGKSAEETEKEQRKKILKYRRAKSRYALPKISIMDDQETIAKANAEIEAANAVLNDDNKETPETTETDTNEQSTPTVQVSSDPEDNDKDKPEDEEKKEDLPDNHLSLSDSVSVSSFQSVEELTLSAEQEGALTKLETDLESADPDYYGFVDYQNFMSILKENDINLSAKQETFLMGGLTLIGML